MSWGGLIAIIIIFIIGAISNGNGSKKKDNSLNSSDILDKKQSLLDKFGERDLSISLIERNKDIIEFYVQKLKEPGYRDYYYIDNFVRDCINDIGIIEGDYNIIPGGVYLSKWMQSVNNNTYLELSKELSVIFTDRINAIKQTFKFKSKYLGLSESLKLNELSKIDKLIVIFIDKITQKEIEITSAINRIIIGDDMLYHTFVEIEIKEKIAHTVFGDITYSSVEGLNKEIISIKEKTLEELLIKIGEVFKGNLSDKENQKILIGDTVDSIIKSPLEGFSIDFDNSDISNIDNVLESLYFEKTDTFISLDYANKGIFYLQNELNIFKRVLEKIESTHKVINQKHLNLYKTAKLNINQLIETYNKTVLDIQKSYNIKQKNGIEARNKNLILESTYDSFFEKSFELEYIQESSMLIVEYSFPDLDSFPKVKEIKELSNGNLRKLLYSNKSLCDLYENYLTSVCIRLMYEVYKNDVINAIESISFNGRIKTIDKSSGNDQTICIMSIQTKKEDFNNMKLNNIDPKITFKTLKGISASKLSTLTPIRPVLSINKKDKRFVDGYDVIDDLDTSTNLADMDWQDFENLIRELFEKIYSKNGGEVKVTQASKDGGVDAIAFDPDPIKGGKTIIQAKRYNNVVGVAAVRELYGSVHNEGALKGILVTTSNYGIDAYKYAEDNRIRLINGSELLYLLEEHGYHASIKLKKNIK